MHKENDSSPVLTENDSATSLTVPEGASEAAVLTPAARAFLAALSNRFEPVRRQLLQRRKERAAELRAGKSLDFLEETSAFGKEA